MEQFLCDLYPHSFARFTYWEGNGLWATDILNGFARVKSPPHRLVYC